MDKIFKFEKYFKINEEGDSGGSGSGDIAGGGTAYSNLGNTNGMGAVKAPQPGTGSNGAVSSSVSDSTKGSGDLPAKSFKPFTKEKKKKSKKSKKKDKSIDKMYVTKWTDWKNVN